MGQGQSVTSDLASTFQSLERMQFSKELQKNPAQYNAYVNTRIDQMTGEIFNRKRAAFQKAHIDLGRYMDMDHNASYYKERAGDVDRLTGAMEEGNQKLLENVEHDKNLSKRQFEINDWYNYNKLETLFFLQIFFMAALSMSVVIFLQKNGTVTNAMAGLLTGILVAIVALVGIYRYYYTNRIRDTRLWHRRYFSKTAAPSPPAKCNPNGELELDINAVLPTDLTQRLDEEAGKFSDWQSNLEQELFNYQSTGAGPAPGLLCRK